MKFSILIVDDDQIVCNSLKRILKNDEYRIKIANSAKQALEQIENDPPELVILDVKLPDMNGIDVLKQIKIKDSNLLVIILTAFGNVSLAVEAMKFGAYDFLEKEAEPELVRFSVNKALDNIRLRKEVEELRVSLYNNQNLSQIIAESGLMQDVIALADQFAESDTTILINGETGTGKSLLAEYIHYKSQRFNQVFLTVNCGAIPRELIESELFGYERGAFTGAQRSGKLGLIEKANNGTVFLDEISELSLDLQAKLLQILEKSEFFRVGGVEPVRVNVRFIVATNAQLEELIKNNNFRIDLFYRINVASIHLPALRDRQDDIVPLFKYFINHFNKKFNRSVKKVTKSAEAMFINYFWPGNVRELRNIIERIMLLKKNDVIGETDLCHIQTPKLESTLNPLSFPFCVDLGNGQNLLQEVQKILIQHTLKVADFNKTRAAKLLGIPRTSLQFYIDRYAISKEQPAV